MSCAVPAASRPSVFSLSSTGLMLSLALLLPLPSVAAAPEPQGLVAVSKDGQTVVDVESGLAWSRCVEGMRWSGGRCVGQALRVMQSQGPDLAAARRQADGRPWRVPRAIEMRRVLQRAAGSPGGIDKLFPDTPEGWLWSASATIEAGPVNIHSYDSVMRGRTSENEERLDGLHGWVIDGHTGRARSDMSRDTPLPVRLVRPRD